MAVTPVAATKVIPLMNQAGTGGINNALDIRRGLLTSIFAGTGNDDFIIRPGVLPRKWAVTGVHAPFTWISLRPTAQSTASKIIEIPKGIAIVYIPGQGPFLAYWDSTNFLTMDDAHPTNARIDSIYIEMVDSTGIGAAPEHGCFIKVQNGTPNSIPSAPSLPANVVDLGQALRPAGVNTIANSQITPKRRGASLYGGTRALLEGDSLADVGGYPGERRFRIAPTGSELDHFVDEWGIDDKWHGTNSFSKVSSSVNTTGYVGEAYGSAMSISIPDPGWPYRVEAKGSLQFGLGPGVTVDLVWKIGSASGTQFGGASDGKTNTTGTTLQYYNTAPTGTSAVLNGAQTIHMAMQKVDGPPGNGYFGVSSSRSHMSVTVIPA